MSVRMFLPSRSAPPSTSTPSIRHTLRLATALACAAAAAHARPLPAQLVPTVGSRPAILSLGVAGGFTVPTKNADTPTRVGPNGQAYALLHIPGLPPLRFNFGYQHQTFRDVLGVPSLPGGPSTGATLTTIDKDRSREMLSAVGGITLPLFHLGPVRPYLTAGLGAFHVRTPADTATTTAPGSAAPLVATAPAQSSVSFGVDGGAGLAVALGRVAAFAEGRVQNVYSDRGAIKSARQIKAVPVALGLSVGLF